MLQVPRLVALVFALTAPIVFQAEDATKSAPVRPLTVSLYAYVPDQALIEKVIREHWEGVAKSKVPLKFVTYDTKAKKGWDGYRSDPEDAPDVYRNRRYQP